MCVCFSIVSVDVAEDDFFAPDVSDSDFSKHKNYADDDGDIMTKIVFPKEKDQPEQWPEIVGGIFVVAAIGFMGLTAFQNYQRRKHYQEVPPVVSHALTV